MQLTNEWYYFTSAVDKTTCNKIIELGDGYYDNVKIDKHEEITEEERRTGRKISPESDVSIRISDIKWVDNQWLYDLIFPYMITANKNTGWNFDIRSSETPQLTRYKKGAFYSWHPDGGADNLSIYDSSKGTFMKGYGRKLSMSILLNKDFSGGKFQFANICNGKRKILTPDFKGIGSIIVFPSFMEHRVTPITKGIRYSLVAWFLGPPFK
tara:strand:- start:57 stop:689 length:633 start_codon:yes stop_codon:yes gene_type:complete